MGVVPRKPPDGIAKAPAQRYRPSSALTVQAQHRERWGRWRKPPPTKPRPEDRFWRRAPGGLLGWSGRVLQPDQQMQERKPDDANYRGDSGFFPERAKPAGQHSSVKAARGPR